MNRKNRNSLLLLATLVFIAVVLVIILVVLFIKKNSTPVIPESDSSETGYIVETPGETTGETPGETTGGLIDEPARPHKPLEEYEITYQYGMSYNQTEAGLINGTNYDMLYDYDGDGDDESLKLIFDYDEASHKVGIRMSNGVESVIQNQIELIFTQNSSLDVVGISNNSGNGIGIISRCFNNETGKYDLQLIVWEYYNDTFIEEWNVVYTGAAAPNGFMENGYIHGMIRGEQAEGVTDGNMNGYIKYRSTMMSDMKNMGIILPRDTTGSCPIEYTRYVTGLVHISYE